MEGKRESPRLASIKTGIGITPKTVRERRILDMSYVRILRELERKPHLRKLDDMAKRIYASMRSAAHPRFNTEQREQDLMAIACAVEGAEQEHTNGKTQKLLKIVAEIFVKFIPRNRLREASERFVELANLKIEQDNLANLSSEKNDWLA